MSELAKVSDAEAAFREKIKERIFNNLADIIPEDRFLALVTEAVQQSLLAPQKVENGYYGDRVKESYLCEVVRVEVNKLLSQKMDVWFAQNRDALEAHFKTAVTEQIGATLISAFMSILAKPMQTAVGAMAERMDEMAKRTGGF
jgi:hypothetical protein